MIPKLETGIAAVEPGVEAAVILDGRVPHAMLLELFTERGAGTLIGAGRDGCGAPRQAPLGRRLVLDGPVQDLLDDRVLAALGRHGRAAHDGVGQVDGARKVHAGHKLAKPVPLRIPRGRLRIRGVELAARRYGNSTLAMRGRNREVSRAPRRVGRAAGRRAPGR